MNGHASASDAMRVLAALPERASAAACFGQPATSGERVVIPVAEVTCGLGFGWGRGHSDASGDTPGGEGGGGGGGGGARARAVAVIELGPEGVRVHPIVDQTSVSMAGIAFASAGLAIVGSAVKRLLRETARGR